MGILWLGSQVELMELVIRRYTNSKAYHKSDFGVFWPIQKWITMFIELEQSASILPHFQAFSSVVQYLQAELSYIHKTDYSKYIIFQAQ